MTRLIKIQEIDEFSEVTSIPNAAISETIISSIRELDEKKEMEPFLRQILYDPNETPHGPTEIADILTTHLHVGDEKRLAGFVLKGKHCKKVKSKDVTHQFVKLRQIPELGLMVFAAVGDIQDDAQRNFVRTAKDAGCDYLIIDRQVLSRLFIAYDKICPKDGTPYSDMGVCKEGHQLDKGITLEMEVRERVKYTPYRQQDVSHYGAKRYSEIILLDKHYSREIIRTIIQEVTDKLKSDNYYRNERVKARWGKSPAHVVWLYIACDLEDIRVANWICRTCWISSSLPPEMRPSALNGNEKLGEIDILWNDNYKSIKEARKNDFGTKEKVLNSVQTILKEMVNSAKQAIRYFGEYSRGNISEQDFILKMQEMEPKVHNFYLQSGDIPHPPQDCIDYDNACHNIFATIDDMFLYYSARGLAKWSRKNRDWLMQDSIKQYYDELKMIELEERKIH
jgi:hypothetical protein